VAIGGGGGMVVDSWGATIGSWGAGGVDRVEGGCESW